MFYANAAQIFVEFSNPTLVKANAGFDQATVVDVTAHFKSLEWNHIILEVVEDSGTYTISFVFNHNISNKVTFATTATNQAFSGVYFCHVGACLASEFYWASAFYKDVRVWDGENASVATVINYSTQ